MNSPFPDVPRNTNTSNQTKMCYFKASFYTCSHNASPSHMHTCSGLWVGKERQCPDYDSDVQVLKRECDYCDGIKLQRQMKESQERDKLVAERKSFGSLLAWTMMYFCCFPCTGSWRHFYEEDGGRSRNRKDEES
ncbi:hypothetical protein HYFRA_00013677 [Hymenoscyphus fraxineus]|uniref:Uncharacterized protein n=1 Tax=Hymenoscyphus fraxineus TaxID=746836 RepID=A0A9N9LCT9_9HELO|nr:hypothetical protein HYFRA_00013677 [Hymenoscyphus fraxineus]